MTLLLQLFWTFLQIGLFTFGGGLSMIALIQGEVVTTHGWLSLQEFTDILAISQMTPGPIGINTATFVGYTAMVNAGYAPWLGVVGAFFSSFAAILLPFVLMLLVTRFLLKHQSNPLVDGLFRVLRVAVVGLVAAAALTLKRTEPTKTAAKMARLTQKRRLRPGNPKVSEVIKVSAAAATNPTTATRSTRKSPSTNGLD